MIYIKKKITYTWYEFRKFKINELLGGEMDLFEYKSRLLKKGC
jgi:hypothetical protein